MYLLTQKKRTVLQLLLLKTMMKALLQKNKGIGMYIPVVEPAFFLIKKNWMCMEHLLPSLFEILLNFKFSVRLVKIQEVQLYVSVLCKVGLWFAYGPASCFCVLSVHNEFSRSYKKKTKRVLPVIRTIS